MLGAVSVLCLLTFKAPLGYAQGAEKVGMGGRDSSSLVDMGIADGKRGNWDGAITNLKKAAELEPKQVNILINLSVAYAEKKRF